MSIRWWPTVRLGLVLGALVVLAVFLSACGSVSSAGLTRSVCIETRHDLAGLKGSFQSTQLMRLALERRQTQCIDLGLL